MFPWHAIEWPRWLVDAYRIAWRCRMAWGGLGLWALGPAVVMGITYGEWWFIFGWAVAALALVPFSVAAVYLHGSNDQLAAVLRRLESAPPDPPTPIPDVIRRAFDARYPRVLPRLDLERDGPSQ